MVSGRAIAIAVMFLAWPVLRAQTAAPVFDASNLREPADLGSTWLVHDGDDPAYAQPGFDDSAWARFDPHNDLNTVFPHQRPSLVWFRLHVKVSPQQTGLALKELNISRAFEIYVNGQRLMVSGQVSPFVNYTSYARLLKRIPDRDIATGSLVIAVRVHISPIEWRNGQFPGLYASNLAVGQFDTLYRDDWLTVIGQNALIWADHLLLIGLGLVALVLFIAQRRQTVYLWIFALGALTLLQLPEPLIAAFRNIPTHWEITSDLLRVFSPFLWASLYFSFVHQRIGWRWSTFLIFAGVMNAISSIEGLVLTSPLPFQALTNLPFILLLSVIVPIVLAIHIRRGNREAGILLVPLLLFSLYIYAEVALGTLFQFTAWRQTALRGLNLIDRFPAGPFAVSLDNVAGILSTLALALIMLLRSTRTIRREAMLDSELAAAQQVQQVLLPEHAGNVPGFAVESIYEPAEQVGGDFFQVLPAFDGGLQVVVGDVAGKGIPAAMLVSVLVGSIRTAAEITCGPDELLSRLNERLVGRTSGGFSTALAAHISPDGRVTIANAGHLSPYLDGVEVELPGALPLGVLSGAQYEVREFYLAPGSRITFYSDGVIEAQNARGELFGFERGKTISTQPAATIVQAAKHFGQQDDITVVTIERVAAVSAAA
jgi:sigma-B regulation protein RsbU (phosphoserine phosphatase)